MLQYSCSNLLRVSLLNLRYRYLEIGIFEPCKYKPYIVFETLICNMHAAAYRQLCTACVVWFVFLCLPQECSCRFNVQFAGPGPRMFCMMQYGHCTSDFRCTVLLSAFACIHSCFSLSHICCHSRNYYICPLSCAGSRLASSYHFDSVISPHSSSVPCSMLIQRVSHFMHF